MSVLSEKQIAFCQEYIIDLNATQAAIRAGYSKKTANEQAARLLVNVSIQEKIQELVKDRSERTGITADMVIKELAAVGFSNIENYVINDNGTVETDAKAPTSAMQAVSSIKRKVRSFGNQGDKEIDTEIRLWPKVEALKQLGQHLGIFEKDNRQKAQGNEIDWSKLSESALQEIINATRPKP